MDRIMRQDDLPASLSALIADEIDLRLAATFFKSTMLVLQEREPLLHLGLDRFGHANIALACKKPSARKVPTFG